jgi:hypothetical protein
MNAEVAEVRGGTRRRRGMGGRRREGLVLRTFSVAGTATGARSAGTKTIFAGTGALFVPAGALSAGTRMILAGTWSIYAATKMILAGT